MEPETTDASWWQRLLFGLLALVLSLILLIAWTVVRAFRIDPQAQWSNGGVGQVVGYIGIMGGVACLATYFLFVAPLVLFWPAWSQRKHWYAMLAAATLWPPVATLLLYWQHPFMALQAIRYFPGSLVPPELFALCSCGCYLLLIGWQHRRVRAVSPGAAIVNHETT